MIYVGLRIGITSFLYAVGVFLVRLYRSHRATVATYEGVPGEFLRGLFSFFSNYILCRGALGLRGLRPSFL